MKTPIFIFEKQKLEQNYKSLESLCKKYFSSFKIAYSVKTNSSPLVIKTLASLGSSFEVASLEEIKLAKGRSKFIVSEKTPSLSIKKTQNRHKVFLIFNGPAKTEEELKIAIKQGFLINIDSKSEIDKIANIIKNKKIEANLRITLEDWKFGVEDSKIEEIIDYARSKGILIIGLHLHQGTQLNLKKYEDSLIIFENILERIKDKIKLKYIDVGGGLPDKTQLKNLSLSMNNYLEVISKHLSKFNATIILEPGRAIASEAFYLLTKVIAIKKNFNSNYAVLDAGINLLPRAFTYSFSTLDKKEKKMNRKSREDYRLVGPLLFSSDYLGKFRGSLQEGDIIKVDNVGAYCYNLSWEISYKKPGIICR